MKTSGCAPCRRRISSRSDPDNGQPATEQTEVRIVYNADKLYMGVTLFDSEPDKLIYYQMGRDGNLPADDKLQWAIDTFNDGRTAYWWEMNPLGSMADALRGANNANNRQWDGIWDARATRSEIGWTLEIEVPFRTMNFNPDSDAWGINFQRTIARKNEVSLWMGWPRNQGLNRMSNAGLLTGIRDVTQGHGLDVKPYVVGTSESFPGRGDSSVTNDANVGVDLFYNLTPQLRANLTVNTDFAQAEVDARQVNLTRFSLLFPEKRDFFLDGSLFFDFASAAAGGGGARGRRRSHSVLQPPDRARRTRYAAADQFRQQADRAGWRLRHRRPSGPDRRGRTSVPRRRLRRDAHQAPDAARILPGRVCTRSVTLVAAVSTPVRPWVSISGWRLRRFSDPRT